MGKDNYAAQITDNAKYVKKPNSEIMRWTNRIIKYIGFTLIPVGIALFCKQVFISHQGFNDAIVGVVAALIGMIPEGLILLTSVVFAVSIIRLSQHKTLVQELYCIETLARVDAVSYTHLDVYKRQTRMVTTKLTMLTNKIKRFFLKYIYEDACLFFILTHSFQNNFSIPLFVTIILCHTILHVVCKNMSKMCKIFNFIYADNFSRLIPAICSIGTL